MDEQNEPRWWLGWTRRRWQAIAYVVLVATFVTVSWNNNRAIDREVIDRQIEDCNVLNVTQQILMEIVEAAVAGSTAADLTSAPNFENLDPEIQQYLRELNGVLADNAEPTPYGEYLIRFAHERLMPRDCSAIDRR